MPDVGIVMPVYTQKPEYLAAAIRTLLNQSFDHLRLIIVIDGVPDMYSYCLAAIDNDPRVEFVHNPHNLGIAKALNRGFEVLFQDPEIAYVTWVSSDNIHSPHLIEVLRRVLHQSPDVVGLVYSSYRSVDGKGHLLCGEQELANQRQFQSQSKDALLDSNVIGASFMYKACYAKRIEGYHLEPVEDFEYWVRLTELCEIRYIPVELMDYRVLSEHSISATLQTPHQLRRARFAFHTARHQARIRRGIQTEVTFLFSPDAADDQALNQLENIYNQSFGNYEIFFLDRSTDRSYSEVLSQIPHPTFSPLWVPGASFKEALLFWIGHVISPFVMVPGPDPFASVLELGGLVKDLRSAGSERAANYYTPDRLIGYRAVQVYEGPIYNQLFRTERLMELLHTEPALKEE